jgi:hypothetical protein
MGVLINATESKQIKILGSDITVNSVYARLNFKCYPNGLSIEIGFDIYSSKAKYAEGIKLFTDVPDGAITVQIDEINEIQSVDSAHTYAISHFNSLGYSCQYL